MKLTRHNSRSGSHGVYNPKHNDRNFSLENSEHILPAESSFNVYWDYLIVNTTRLYTDVDITDQKEAVSKLSFD